MFFFPFSNVNSFDHDVKKRRHQHTYSIYQSIYLFIFIYFIDEKSGAKAIFSVFICMYQLNCGFYYGMIIHQFNFGMYVGILKQQIY